VFVSGISIFSSMVEWRLFFVYTEMPLLCLGVWPGMLKPLVSPWR